MTATAAFALPTAVGPFLTKSVGPLSTCASRKLPHFFHSSYSPALRDAYSHPRRRPWHQTLRMSVDRFTEDIKKPTIEGEFRQVHMSSKYEFQGFYASVTGERVSPWHDIPLYVTNDDLQIVNFINEIPKNTRRKYEMRMNEAWNPIMQDVWKDGQLRYYKYGDSLVNYGALPQTWEDPNVMDEVLKVGGDGDPVDVVEIGERTMPFGLVYEVKILGALALLDEGEIDWKIIAINVEDPLANELKDIDDVDRLLPGRLQEVREWFRLYKTAEGKGENDYGFDGIAQSADFAINVVRDTHRQYKRLVSGITENLDSLWLREQEENKEKGENGPEQ